MDGWSCGYRAIAYAWHLANGTTYPELADLQFDIEELPKWLMKCLQDKEITKPPTVHPGRHDKRVASIKTMGKFWNVNVMKDRIMRAVPKK